MAQGDWLGHALAEVASPCWPGLGWGSGSSCGLSRARLNRSEPLGGDPTDRNGGEGAHRGFFTGEDRDGGATFGFRWCGVYGASPESQRASTEAARRGESPRGHGRLSPCLCRRRSCGDPRRTAARRCRDRGGARVPGRGSSVRGGRGLLFIRARTSRGHGRRNQRRGHGRRCRATSALASARAPPVSWRGKTGGLWPAAVCWAPARFLFFFVLQILFNFLQIEFFNNFGLKGPNHMKLNALAL